jgi:hypothetical protein
MKFIDLSEDKYFLIKCSDWSVVISANNETEACTQALVCMLDRRGKDLKLSSVMISNEMKHDVMDEDYDELVSYHSVSQMLANAGMHDLSTNLKNIFGA